MWHLLNIKHWRAYLNFGKDFFRVLCLFNDKLHIYTIYRFNVNVIIGHGNVLLHFQAELTNVKVFFMQKAMYNKSNPFEYWQNLTGYRKHK